MKMKHMKLKQIHKKTTTEPAYCPSCGAGITVCPSCAKPIQNTDWKTLRELWCTT